ncbi:MAG: methylated-DNA--[protein]-cysteine S-methyltransferase [Gammaproteobacteria bacterium]|nr:methylated-DNA--[protein]-cysteine S-methyltransferase [Gammaproteobacteria bacterium]
MTKAQYQTPIGVIAVTLVNERITELELGQFEPQVAGVHYDPQYTGVLKQLGEQLSRYFAEPGSSFDVTTDNQGTAYQRRVWRALQQIPAGQTRTYGQLAEQLHSSPRAVGNACRQNPVPLLVPCHRVVAANGLGGFGGETQGKRLAMKRWLLEHEGATI